jgi:hypothetical protein
MKFLIILNWTPWSALLIALLYALGAMLTERSSSPEARPALGVFLIGLGLLFSAASGSSLYWLAQKQSIAGLIVMTMILAWPLVSIIGRPLAMALKDWKYTHSKGTTGNLSTS